MSMDIFYAALQSHPQVRVQRRLARSWTVGGLNTSPKDGPEGHMPASVLGPPKMEVFLVVTKKGVPAEVTNLSIRL